MSRADRQWRAGAELSHRVYGLAADGADIPSLVDALNDPAGEAHGAGTGAAVAALALSYALRAGDVETAVALTALVDAAARPAINRSYRGSG